MRGMSSILRIALYPDAPSPNEPWEREDGRSGRYSPEELFPFSFSSLREGS